MRITPTLIDKLSFILKKVISNKYDALILLSFVLSLYDSHLLFSAVMPRFAEQVEVAIEALSTNPPQAFEENEFIDASRLVYDGVRDIRKAVLMIRVCPVPPLKGKKESSDLDSGSNTQQAEIIMFGNADQVQ